MAKKKDLTEEIEDILGETLDLDNYSSDVSTWDDIERLGSTSDKLDDLMCGGYPKGRIITIYGPEASGKTTLSFWAMAEAQKQGKRALFLDMESAFNANFAVKHGLNIKKPHFYLKKPKIDVSAEKVFDNIVEVMQKKLVDVIVLDSIPALITKSEMDTSFEKSQRMALLAAFLSTALKKLAVIAETTGVTLFLINQIREKPGQLMGNPEGMPGGRALKHFSTLILCVKPKSVIKSTSPQYFNQSGEQIGHPLRVKVVKTRCGNPHVQGEIDLIYNPGRLMLKAVMDEYNKEKGLFEVQKNNKKRFSYNGVKGEIKEKDDYEFLISWLHENDFFFDFLEKKGINHELTIKELLKDKDLFEADLERYEIFQEEGEWPEKVDRSLYSSDGYLDTVVSSANTSESDDESDE